MSKPRKYLPIAESSSRRPFIPQAPLPVLPKLSHAVRVVMWPRRLMLEDVLTLRLTASAAERIRVTMNAQAEAERVAAAARIQFKGAPIVLDGVAP